MIPKQEILEVELQGQLQGFQEKAPLSSECGDAQDRREKSLGDPSSLKRENSPEDQGVTHISDLRNGPSEEGETKNSGPVLRVQTLFLVSTSQQQGDPSLGMNMGTTANTG